MGQCVSCCDDARRSSPSASNGHAVPPAAGATLLPSLAPPVQVSDASSALSAQQKQQRHTDPPDGDCYPGSAGKNLPFAATATSAMLGGSGGGGAGGAADNSKKTFGPYAKLPPIRKHSAGSGAGSGAADGRKSVTRAAGGSAQGSDVNDNKIQALFECYKDPDEDGILAEGIERLCQDLQVKPEEFKVLVLAWKFNAQQMCYFSREEMVEGCKSLRVDSIKGIQRRFPDLLQEVLAKHIFKDLYRWTYKFGLESGQRTLPTEVAIVLWKLVFHQNEPVILDRWLEFLAEHPSIRGIPKDTWDMFLNLTEAVGDDLSTYDDTEAWPSLFDDFVEYENDRQNQNVTSKDIKVSEDF